MGLGIGVPELVILGVLGAIPVALRALIADERSRGLWQKVAALPSGERTAVILYYRDEVPVRDIARALGVTTGTIKTLLFRARRHLRSRLQEIST